jgi:hypothetical protein
MPGIMEIGAVIVDCRDAAPMAAFYQKACGGEITRRDDDSVWMKLAGTIVIFREVAGYRAPTWPAPDVPMQVHLDFFVNDLDEAAVLLRQCGASRPEHQPHDGDGLVVWLDPAGHPFCIALRPNHETSPKST